MDESKALQVLDEWREVLQLLAEAKATRAENRGEIARRDRLKSENERLQEENVRIGLENKQKEAEGRILDQRYANLRTIAQQEATIKENNDTINQQKRKKAEWAEWRSSLPSAA